jgi:hypothetical protein
MVRFLRPQMKILDKVYDSARTSDSMFHYDIDDKKTNR